MSFAFDPTAGAIVVAAELTGPSGRSQVNLLLDTGANTTVIAEAALATAGYDPADPPGQIPITTASAVSTAGVFIVAELASLGLSRANIPVLSHTLPPGVDVDGLLGIDFFEGHILTLDFINHTLGLV